MKRSCFPWRYLVLDGYMGPKALAILRRQPGTKGRCQLLMQ